MGKKNKSNIFKIMISSNLHREDLIFLKRYEVLKMAILAKICFLGDGEVGKTSLINQYLGKGFSSEYLPTLGSDFISKELSCKTDNGLKIIRLQIWDLAGQPNFKRIRSLYYKGAVGVFLVCDLTRLESLETLDKWYQEYLKHCEIKNHHVIVLGNKKDLKNELKITPSKIKNYIMNTLTPINSDNTNQIDYFETSAKTSENVYEVFEHLGRKILKNIYQ